MNRAQQSPSVAVRHLEIELGIDQVRHVLAQVVGHAAGPRDRPRTRIGDRVGLAKHADLAQPVQEDPVAEQQLLHVGVDPGKAVEHRLNAVEHAVVEVVEHAAHARVTRVEAVARHLLVDVVDQLPQVEGVQERGERPQVERRGAGAEQVIADPRQLGDDHANVLAPRRQLDAQQLLDRVVPRHLVHRRADVVLAVDDRDVLVELEVFAQLLEPGVQVADVRRRLDDPLAVELEDQPQRRVGGRMLRPEVERPGGLLRLGGEARVVEQLGGSSSCLHWSNLPGVRPSGFAPGEPGEIVRSPRPRSG